MPRRASGSSVRSTLCSRLSLLTLREVSCADLVQRVHERGHLLLISSGALDSASRFLILLLHLLTFAQLVNSAGILLLTQAILVLQPTATPKQKTNGTHIHFTLNLAGTLALVAGLIIIEMNKASHPKTRFQSIHGIMGLVTFILIIIQALIGFAQFYVPRSVFGSVDSGKKLYKYHRMSGYLILLLALATVCAVVKTDFNKNVLHIQLWAVVVASVLVVAGVVPRIRKHKFGF